MWNKNKKINDCLKHKLILEQTSTSLIDVLKKDVADGYPVVMWGAGSLSASMQKMLFQNGINIDAVLVNKQSCDECYETQVFSYEEIVCKYKKFDLVCGHSRYELVDQFLHEHAEINRIFCFVNVCYGQWEGISSEFIMNHIDEYEQSYGLFDDDLSRDCFAAYLNSRSNEDYRYILPCYREKVSYFRNPFFELKDHEVYLDVGAFDGDTIREFLSADWNEKKWEKIIAIEPEALSRNKLERYVNSLSLDNIVTYSNGCWDKEDTLLFNISDESSSIDDHGVKLEVKRIDEQFINDGVTLIKINYLNGVVETLKGAEKVLKMNKPNLAITVGFDEWGIIHIPQIIKKINPSYKLGLRYASPMPARLILFGF